MPTRAFSELYDLNRFPAPTDIPAGSRIVYSALRRGEAQSEGDGLAIKYVLQGVEHYGFRRGSISVKPGQMLLVPQGLSSEVSIRHGEDGPTIGMCVFLRNPADAGDGGCRADAPILLPAQTSALGRTLASVTRQLAGQPRPDAHAAEALLGFAESHFEDFAAEIGAAVDALPSARPQTRWSLYRRLSIARAKLHDTLDQTVSLSELAGIVGMSQFQLARDFRACFGAPPARYHRTVRLNAAQRELERGVLSCLDIAHKFGFSDASSFGRAYRVEFGRSPIRTLR